MDLKVLKLTNFFHFKKGNIDSIQFDGKINDMICQLRYVSIFTPRCLTFSVGYSILLYDFLFR